MCLCLCEPRLLMGKRGAGADSGAAKAKASKVPRRNSTDEVDSQVAKALVAAEAIPWWGDATLLLEKILGNRGAAHFFETKFPNVEARKALAERFLQAFPLPSSQTLSSDLSSGVKTLQFWQTCWHPQGGNRGMASNDVFSSLVQLILLQGFKTDASLLAGTEYPVLQAVQPVYFDSPWDTPELVPNTMGLNSVALLKGWTRCLAMTTAAFIITELNVVDYYKQQLPEQYQSYCVMKGMVPSGGGGSEIDRIAAHRGSLFAKLGIISGIMCSCGCRIRRVVFGFGCTVRGFEIRAYRSKYKTKPSQPQTRYPKPPCSPTQTSPWPPS